MLSFVSPCIGPILTALLMLGATNPDQAFIYITVYKLGFAIPFFLIVFFVTKEWNNTSVEYLEIEVDRKEEYNMSRKAFDIKNNKLKI
jgi:cytochrome c biogenesis protein CcdA